MDKNKKLEEMATKLTGIKPITDKEYQYINYEKFQDKQCYRRMLQKRSNIFKTARKRI